MKLHSANPKGLAVENARVARSTNDGARCGRRTVRGSNRYTPSEFIVLVDSIECVFLEQLLVKLLIFAD